VFLEAGKHTLFITIFFVVTYKKNSNKQCANFM